ncbi:hypothetical protein CERSUDRAFT_99233 [Gelatoporia subvermispora B]|uniref:DUF6534 domain-containing protein n=1 Tax=Ceriporiopsis subvermispora (strain B) TaxID=914234 RepID=M2R2P8_CERS8|nr:hypothetical protein CERSUDRAFT_99233 [Gelatoporia subvermispora B]
MSQPLEHSSLNSTLGAGLIGLVVAAIFFGITNVQMYMYYRRYSEDPLYLRVSFALLWILDTLHQILITQSIYTYAVTQFGNPAALGMPTWSFLVNVVVTGVSDASVRILFSLRLWRFSEKNWYITAPVMIGAVASLVGSIAFTIKAAPLHSFAAFSSISWCLYIGLASGAVADVLLATSLVVLLWKKRTGFHRTDSLVRTLMIYTINSGLLTSVCAIMCFVTFTIMPDNFIYFALFMVLPKRDAPQFPPRLIQRSEVHARCGSSDRRPSGDPSSE